MKRALIFLTILFLISTAFTQLDGNKGKGILNIGDEAPNIKLKSYKGKKQKLSKYKGKLVLVKFWASWCMPCRVFKNDWTRIYDKYKDVEFENGKKGFDVFSISLDDNKKAFKKASKQDKIPWQANTVDLDGFNSIYAFNYGVNSLPSEFLIDGKGNVIAKDLTPYQLEDLLEQMKAK